MTQGEFDNNGVAQFGVNDNDEDKFNNTLKVAIPIGGVVAWLKSLSGVPDLTENYVECNGQVLSDSNSPLNGETMPDMNGSNQFIRGNSISTGTGTGSHTHTIGTTSGSLYTGSGTTTVGNTVTQPPYQDVVFIIRVK